MLVNKLMVEKNITIETLQQEAIDLLKALISIPSFSKEEAATADCIQAFFTKHQVASYRLKNNIWSKNLYYGFVSF